MWGPPRKGRLWGSCNVRIRNTSVAASSNPSKPKPHPHRSHNSPDLIPTTNKDEAAGWEWKKTREEKEGGSSTNAFLARNHLPSDAISISIIFLINYNILSFL
ncbi:hypothetical protein HN873_044813 [Arachis hypogaea]